MPLIAPDAFYHCYRSRRATYEVLKAFRAHHPASHVSLVVDGGGHDFGDIAARFGCHYRQCEANVNPSACMPKAGLQEWVDRFVTAAKAGAAEFIILLEDDVLVRGPIHRSDRFASAGPWHNSARFSDALMNELRKAAPHFAAANAVSNYGGCGGTLFHRESLIDAAARFDWSVYDRWIQLDSRVAYADAFLTLMFTLAGHQYSSAHDVFCETWYPVEDRAGRPIVHRFDEWENEGESIDMLDDLAAAGMSIPA